MANGERLQGAYTTLERSLDQVRQLMEIVPGGTTDIITIFDDPRDHLEHPVVFVPETVVRNDNYFRAGGHLHETDTGDDVSASLYFTYPNLQNLWHIARRLVHKPRTKIAINMEVVWPSDSNNSDDTPDAEDTTIRRGNLRLIK